ncbi:hypothetical protein FPQ18DRAFT_322097 [Pyronema domesticum]|nr:hypothetical protein FPQ18DRAFT_322097 [Pyronema domesticum]
MVLLLQATGCYCSCRRVMILLLASAACSFALLSSEYVSYSYSFREAPRARSPFLCSQDIMAVTCCRTDYPGFCNYVFVFYIEMNIFHKQVCGYAQSGVTGCLPRNSCHTTAESNMQSETRERRSRTSVG